MNSETVNRKSVFTEQKAGNHTAEIALCGVFSAIICVFTMFVQIRIFPAEGGMVHIGNVPLFFAAAFFGKKVGAVAGGTGMMLSDLLSGWTIYAPVTFIVTALMGAAFGKIVNGKPCIKNLIAASLAALLIKITGYYIGEVILYRSVIVPLASVPGNAIQIVTGAVIAIPVILASGTAIRRLQKKGK